VIAVGSQLPDASKTLRLLVVEDSDDDYRILLREVRRAGYVVESRRVQSSSELAEALATPWDLMITDWMIPGSAVSRRSTKRVRTICRAS
jgi:DNA-binding response OmpR family regulator